MDQQLNDPVIDEIREIRHQISALCGHDPKKLVAYFQQLQEQYRDRLITAPRVPADDAIDASETLPAASTAK